MQREQTNQITVPYSLFAKKTTCHDQRPFFFFLSISSLEVSLIVKYDPLRAVEIHYLMFWADRITMSKPSVYIYFFFIQLRVTHTNCDTSGHLKV